MAQEEAEKRQERAAEAIRVENERIDHSLEQSTQRRRLSRTEARAEREEMLQRQVCTSCVYLFAVIIFG